MCVEMDCLVFFGGYGFVSISSLLYTLRLIQAPISDCSKTSMDIASALVQLPQLALQGCLRQLSRSWVVGRVWPANSMSNCRWSVWWQLSPIFWHPHRDQHSLYVHIIPSPGCSRPCMQAFSLCSPCLVVCAVVRTCL